MSLYDATRDLHHAVEHTALGQVMVSGTPSRSAYAAWIAMKLHLYERVDRHLLPASRRTEQLKADMESLGVDALSPSATRDFADALRSGDEKMITGTAYVLVGGNLMGGEVLRRSLCGRFPVRAFTSPDRASEMAILRQYRQRVDCVDEARACFRAILDACGEISREAL